MRLALALAGCLAAFPAAAGGSLWCDSVDDKVTIEVRSGMLHNLGHPLNGFHAAIRIDDDAVPADLREVDASSLKQYWFDLETLNLMFAGGWRSVGEVGYVQARLTTTHDLESDEFLGEFEVEVIDVGVFGPGGGLTYTGRVRCIAGS